MPLRFVTIVTEDFWPGLAALVQSIADNGELPPDSYEFKILCNVSKAPQAWLEARSERIELVPLDTLPQITLLSQQNQGSRMENAMQKLGVFALPPAWGTCIYIDCDIICLASLRGLEEFTPLTAAADMPCFSQDLHKVDRFDPNFEFNTGLFVFQPNQRVFDELGDVYRRRHQERTHKGDQDIFNLWVLEKDVPVRLAGSEWNFGKRYQDFLGRRRTRDCLTRVKLLHFVGVKPWADNSRINTFRECRYSWLEKIWWDHFERSGFAAHMEKPPSRSTAFRRQWILPWTKPEILREHCVRAGRLLRKTLRIQRPEHSISGHT
jgi:lipopolysaccharide biosynthesis glycosyltransferase